MEVLRTILLYSESKDMPFLLIGGHAINHYGLSRQTGDVDLLVRRDQKEEWNKLLERLSYSSSQNDLMFARYRAKELGAWPIDLMFVEDSTFGKLMSSAEKGEVGVATVKIVSAEHLATLKIHALKSYHQDRYAKDYNDLLWLVRSQKTGLELHEIKEICLKYATQDLYDRMIRDLKKD